MPRMISAAMLETTPILTAFKKQEKTKETFSTEMEKFSC